MMISKTKGGYVVKNASGTKRLSKIYPTREQAEKRLKQIEYFKSKK